MKVEKPDLFIGTVAGALSALLILTLTYSVGPYLFTARLIMRPGESLLLPVVAGVWFADWLVGALLVLPLAVASTRALLGKSSRHRIIDRLAWLGLGFGVAAVAAHAILGASTGSGLPQNARQWAEVSVVAAKLGAYGALLYAESRSLGAKAVHARA